MKKDNSLTKSAKYLDLPTSALEERLKETKAKLLSIRADVANRKLKNVKQVNFERKEVARILFLLAQKKKAENISAETVKETK